MIRHYLIKIGYCPQCGKETRINYNDRIPRCKRCHTKLRVKKKEMDADLVELTYKHRGLNWVNMMKGVKWIDLRLSDFRRLNEIVKELNESI